MRSIGFLAFGDRNLASSRFRAWDVADAWGVPCEIWDESDDGTTDIIILQKVHPKKTGEYAHDLEGWMARQHRAGRTILWDLCDPVWWWMSEERFTGLLQYVKAVIVSSEGLLEHFTQEFPTPAVLIRDRVPYQERMRHHCPTATPKMIWFGYSRNRLYALASAEIILERLMRNAMLFSLEIVDEHPEYGRIRGELAERLIYTKWSRDTIWDRLLSSDVALLPPYPGVWGRMKSENKPMMAWWAGLPVSDAMDYRHLVSLLTDVRLREAIGRENRMRAEKDYHIQRSVEEWEAVVSRL